MIGNNRIRFIFYAIVSVAFFTLLIYACGGKGTPDSAAKKAVEGELSQKLQTILDEYRESMNIKGISAAVILPGDRIWLGVSGNSSDSVEISPDMLFGVGSLTKTYIAALTLKYVEDGKISLDDQIGKWIANIEYVDPSITIRQLLNHTSGVYNYMTNRNYGQALMNYPDTLWTRDELLKSFLSKPTFKPGSAWGYSAANYILLGMIIERLTGNPVSYELKERILTPSGLTNTYLYPEETCPVEKMAHLWVVIDTTGVPVDINERMSSPPHRGVFSSVWTAGAIYATAEDAAGWLQSLFNKRVLSEPLLKEMTMPTKLSGRVRYGLGIIADSLNGTASYSYSGGIGYSSSAYYIPRDTISIAVFGNSRATLISLAAGLHKACTEMDETKTN